MILPVSTAGQLPPLGIFMRARLSLHDVTGIVRGRSERQYRRTGRPTRPLINGGSQLTDGRARGNGR